MSDDLVAGRRSSMILVHHGNQHRTFAEPFTIGRKGKGATLELDDEYVSPRHAVVYPDGGQWFIEDIGSTNGVRRAWYGPTIWGATPLHKGDVIQVGRTALTFVPD